VQLEKFAPYVHRQVGRSIVLALACAALAYGQTATAPKPEPDTLTLSSGESLIGHFVRSYGGNVVFKSDGLGELTIAWAKVKELHAAEHYVVVGKDVKLTRRTDISSLPKGTVAVADQTVVVEPEPGAPLRKVPVGDAAYVVNEATFQKVLFHGPSFFDDWKGAVTGGASLIEATQRAQTFTGGIALIRAVPEENWLSLRNRTLIDFSATDGHITQPDTPRIKTAIYHADIERDEYFRGKDLYLFGEAAFDHNFSQGLDLQSNTGGGLGYTAVKKANETLDFKASMTFIKQEFHSPGINDSLLGSNFIESFTRKTARGVLFLQEIAITPAWTNLDAYSGVASGSVSVPVFKQLGFTTAISDNFLNNPPPGFKKNSFQLTTGLTYTLK
jgi:Protein of unknown function, DUF481